MATYYPISDRISLSPLDVHILVSLLDGQNNGYDLARSCEARMHRTAPIGSSNVYKALKSMQKMMLVASVASKSSDRRQKTIYRISSLGRMILEQEIMEQARFIGVAQALLADTENNKTQPQPIC